MVWWLPEGRKMGEDKEDKGGIKYKVIKED